MPFNLFKMSKLFNIIKAISALIESNDIWYKKLSTAVRFTVNKTKSLLDVRGTP